MRRQGTSDIARLYFIAALFWFEALGFMVLGAALLVSPFSCWGDRFGPATPASEACAAGEAPYVHDGSLALWALILIAIGIVAVLAWVVTSGRPRWRGAMCLGIAVAAALPIMWLALSSPIAALLLFVWIGVPAIALVGAANALLRTRPDGSTTDPIRGRRPGQVK